VGIIPPGKKPGRYVPWVDIYAEPSGIGDHQFRHRDQPVRKPPRIGHDPPDPLVTILRIHRSRHAGLPGHDAPEYALKWTKAARERLPEWIVGTVQPLIQEALDRAQYGARLEISGRDGDTLLLHYPAVKQGTGYVAPVIKLEFGGRATGEPHAAMPVMCDIDGKVDGVTFPTASPVVMSIARTFWEKATATHVYCAQGRIRGERYARHWHDLAAILRSSHFEPAINNRQVARAVAEHKSNFFSEKDAKGHTIDYFTAVGGALQVVPEGAARRALSLDYASMLEDQVLVGDALPFEDLMAACAEVAARANAAEKT